MPTKVINKKLLTVLPVCLAMSMAGASLVWLNLNAEVRPSSEKQMQKRLQHLEQFKEELQSEREKLLKMKKLNELNPEGDTDA